MARPMPVLPEVGSTIVAPSLSRPRCSASSIIARAMRSLTLPAGLCDSSLATISAAPSGTRRRRATIGVLPTSSRALEAMPGCRCCCAVIMVAPLNGVSRGRPGAFALGEVGNRIAVEDADRGFLDLAPDGAQTTARRPAAAVGVVQAGDGCERAFERADGLGEAQVVRVADQGVTAL